MECWGDALGKTSPVFAVIALSPFEQRELTACGVWTMFAAQLEMISLHIVYLQSNCTFICGHVADAFGHDGGLEVRYRFWTVENESTSK